MYNGKTILALIPARGGSKGLPGKNIRLLLGKPLISWSIGQSLRSRYIDKVVVSTDSEKIASVARRYGAEVPFKRPKKLATDKAKSIDAVLHALDYMRKNGEDYDILVLLQPTSPLRTAEDIDRAIRFLFTKRTETVVSVCEANHPPLWSNTLPPDLNMRKFIKSSIINKNRQELARYYRLNGAIYVAWANYLKKYRTFFGKDTYAYIMDSDRSVDIDTIMDFTVAGAIMKQKMIGEK